MVPAHSIAYRVADEIKKSLITKSAYVFPGIFKEEEALVRMTESLQPGLEPALLSSFPKINMAIWWLCRIMKLFGSSERGCGGTQRVSPGSNEVVTGRELGICFGD